MMRRYILDENVLIFAQEEVNENGEEDLTCSNLLTAIINICHTLVVDPYLWGRYVHQLNQRRHLHYQHGPFLLRTLAEAFQREAKVELLYEDAPGFPTKRAFRKAARMMFL